MNSFELVQGQQFADIEEKKLYHHIIESLFMQFFPESVETKTEEPFSKIDVSFFMKFANDKVPLVQEPLTQSRKLDDKTNDCITLSKFKSYLDRILSRGWSDGRTLKPLNLYKYEV